MLFKKENVNLLFLRAIEGNHSLEMAKYLLKLGANPNIQAEQLFMGHPVKKEYPIIVAAKAVTPNALKFLLEQKVNVNVKGKDGKTPLELLQKIKYLMKDPNYNKFITAFRAGDLDLSFYFRNTDCRTALTAAEEFMCFPLIPALFQLSEESFHLIDLFEEPEPFL